MPLFDFECQKCQKKHELLVGSADILPACPDCGGKLNKLPSLFGVKSGGGFTSSRGGGSCSPGCSKTSCGTCKPTV